MSAALPLVLASSSPRRAELLAHLGCPFDVVAPDVDESVYPDEDAAAYVERLARAKAAAVVDLYPHANVVAADTCVVLDGNILGKPVDDADARLMLHQLSGRRHEVLTAAAVVCGGTVHVHVDQATVEFAELSASEIDWYVGTGEPFDKAGAYAIQGAGGVFVSRLEGNMNTVIGLPLRFVRDRLS